MGFSHKLSDRPEYFVLCAPFDSQSLTEGIHAAAPVLSFEKLRVLARVHGYVASFQASTLYYDIPDDRISILKYNIV